MKTSNMEIIAEIGQAHDGSLGILFSYIDALALTGIDTVKFQIHIAEAESSSHEPFRIPFSFEDKTRFDYWKRMEFAEDQWSSIKEHCKLKGLNFLASPFSIAAVDLMERIGAERYKIGSGEVTNSLMIEKISKTGKPIILSSGMSSFAELSSAVSQIEKHHSQISILQCTTQYPTSPEKIGLNVISELKTRFPNYKVGLSEHTARKETSLAAYCLGAEILEFHVVFDRRMFGPDASSSLTIDEVEEVVQGVEFLDKALSTKIDKNDLEDFAMVKPIFEKTLALNSDLLAGHVLTFSDLESKKPANMGVAARNYKSVLGRKLKHDLSKYSFLTENDLE